MTPIRRQECCTFCWRLSPCGWRPPGLHDTVRSGEPPTDIQHVGPGSKLRRRTRAAPARELPGAGLTYLAGTWIWATIVSFSFGGVDSPGALLYVSLPASAAWLLGYKAAIRTAGGCLLGAVVFTVLEISRTGRPGVVRLAPGRAAPIKNRAVAPSFSRWWSLPKSRVIQPEIKKQGRKLDERGAGDEA